MAKQHDLAQAAEDALRRLERYCRSRDFAGPDPYDGLMSPLARAAVTKRLRQAATQGVKRSPVDLRRVLGIRPVRMSKALSLFVHGYLIAEDLDGSFRQSASALARDIVGSQRASGGWGYEFDVQTRWGFYPAGTPNMVATAFALEALHRVGAPAATLEAAHRWLTGPMLHPAGFFRYVPGNDTLVHNASLLGARALLRAGGPPDREAIHQASKLTADALPPEGLWAYGMGANLAWADSFHTCYILDCMTDLREADIDVGLDLDAAILRWAETFITSDGEVLYFADGRGPLDVHNIASSIDLISRHWPLLAGPASEKSIRKFLGLQNADGGFALPGRPSYMRWNNAHAFRALARLREALR